MSSAQWWCHTHGVAPQYCLKTIMAGNSPTITFSALSGNLRVSHNHSGALNFNVQAFIVPGPAAGDKTGDMSNQILVSKITPQTMTEFTVDWVYGTDANSMACSTVVNLSSVAASDRQDASVILHFCHTS